MSSHDSSPSKDSESSSSIHQPSLSFCEEDATYSYTPESSIPFNLQSRLENDLANEDLPVQIKKPSKTVNPPVYTRRLIPMKYIPVDEIDENFDEQAWFKKLYGPDIIVVATSGLPRGWILVDGN